MYWRTFPAYGLVARIVCAWSEFSQMPFSQIPFSQIPFSQIPFSQIPFSQIPFSQIPFSQIPFSQIPFSQIPFSQIPFVVSPFSQIPFSQMPLDSRSGADVVDVSALGGSLHPITNTNAAIAHAFIPTVLPPETRDDEI